MTAVTPIDLLFLVADKDMEQTLHGLLSRPEAMGCRRLDYQIKVHPERDAGCRSESVTFLRPFQNHFKHVIVLFDHEGSGGETVPAEELETTIEGQLSKNGWTSRCAVAIPSPELEAWIWSSSAQVDRVCGWRGRHPSLRDWLVDQGWISQIGEKPSRPKEAYRAALQEVRKQVSARLFRELATNMSLQACSDRSFQKLKTTISQLFSPLPLQDK